METKEIVKKVKEIVAKETGLRINEISLRSHFEDDLNMDDFERANLFVSVEEEFNVELGQEDTKNIKTVQDLVHFIEDGI